MYLRSKNYFLFLTKKDFMPASRNALIRYKTIDNCLQNRYRQWTLEDLIEACSEALCEYEGNNNGISKRTIQLDIQNMRSEKLGYNAPIVVYNHKFYTYEDPNYSITKTPVSEQDMKQVTEAVNVLKQLSGFAQFGELESIVNRLDVHVSKICHNSTPIVFFEKNDSLKGLQYISPLHEHILKKELLNITYKSFKAILPETIIFSPYALKEYNNRWFIFGKRKGKDMLLNLALDRIEKIEVLPNEEYEENDFADFSTYFDDVIGVTKGLNSHPAKIKFWVSPEQTPYILTKPLHSSQELIEMHEDGSADFKMVVVLNFELERVLLGFGENIIVHSPRILVNRLKERIQKSFEQYHDKQLESEP